MPLPKLHPAALYKGVDTTYQPGRLFAPRPPSMKVYPFFVTGSRTVISLKHAGAAEVARQAFRSLIFGLVQPRICSTYVRIRTGGLLLPPTLHVAVTNLGDSCKEVDA